MVSPVTSIPLVAAADPRWPPKQLTNIGAVLAECHWQQVGRSLDIIPNVVQTLFRSTRVFDEVAAAPP